MKKYIIEILYSILLWSIIFPIINKFNLQFKSIIVGTIFMGVFDIGYNVISNIFKKHKYKE